MEQELILNRLQRFCAYQERCTSDAEKKLREWGIPHEKSATMIRSLKKEGFIDDLRFARSFVSGKFRINRWGRLRIRAELSAKQIPFRIIDQALQVIGEEDYRTAIKYLIFKKKEMLKVENDLTRRNKIISFVAGKGYEVDLVIPFVNEILKNHG